MPSHQLLLDRLQFDAQSLKLTSQHADHLACQRRHAFLARQALQQLVHLLGTLGHGEAELRRVAADRVDQHRALLDQQVTHSEHRQRRLLLGRLDGTNRMLGRLIASQIASASILSFLPRLT